MKQHWAIFVDNDSQKSNFIASILNQGHIDFKNFDNQKGALFSPLAVTKLVDQEERHGSSSLTGTTQSLTTMSSGEQKKALLYHILNAPLDYIILDNPFDNLDADFKAELTALLTQKANEFSLLQFASRKGDALSFITNFGILKEAKFSQLSALDLDGIFETKTPFNGNIPKPIREIEVSGENLVEFLNVSISYEDKPVLHNITWKIKKGDFWQLVGKNGSGKTSILSMIIGDNPKAFGKDIYIFGKKKGTGESVWEIKQNIGYFSPAMTVKFTGRHTIEHMLISGLTDSIGLYIKPTEIQKRTVKNWLVLLNLWDKKNILFKDLSLGQQRLVMTARAMVKHPPLLILDEPTAGMDDKSAQFLVALVNKIAKETGTTIVFVSHRIEPKLLPKSIYRLEITSEGSKGHTHPMDIK